MAQRPEKRYYKDPLAEEYILVEDQRHSIRFERECPNPIWWFDYTQQTRGKTGSTITHVETPDVDVLRSGWVHTEESLTLSLKMVTGATFAGYAVALWDMPSQFDGDPSRIRSNAKEFIVVWNRDGEYHLVLFFDLRPDLVLQISVLQTNGVDAAD